MDWAQRRQLIVIATFVVGIGLVIAGALFAIFYQVPSCMDRTQNQGESGVDCGGPCSTVCTAQTLAPQVRFVRAVVPQPGRTDVIAYIDNPNSTAAAANVRGTVELYDANHALLAKMDTTFDLPPATSVPVFLPAVAFGNQQITQAFLTIDESSLHWSRAAGKPTLPTVTGRTIDPSNTRITATLNNVTAQPIERITVIATVFDAADMAIAASKTIVAELPAQGSAPLVFTWNVPFSGNAARVEIVPISTVTASGV